MIEGASTAAKTKFIPLKHRYVEERRGNDNLKDISWAKRCKSTNKPLT